MVIGLSSLGEEQDKNAAGQVATPHWPPCHAHAEHTSGDLGDGNSGRKGHSADRIISKTILLANSCIFGTQVSNRTLFSREDHIACQQLLFWDISI